jgi:hypothetical protein
MDRIKTDMGVVTSWCCHVNIAKYPGLQKKGTSNLINMGKDSGVSGVMGLRILSK